MDTVFREEKVVETKESIKSELPFYGEILDFYSKIFILQEKEKLSYSPDPLILEEKELSLPLIEKDRFVIDFERAEKLFARILTIAEETNGDLKNFVEILRGSIENRSLNLNELLKDLLEDGAKISKTAESTKIPLDALYIFLYNSIKPFVEISAEQLSNYLKEDEYDGGKCPVCGDHPYLSVFGKNGERFLLCGFCNHKWRSKRMFCPHCECEDKDKLNYFFSENCNFHRVELCDGCKRYIKTVDLRNLERFFYAPLEVLSTKHLDIKAEELGYLPE